MVTPREVRAARALLGWTRQKLADKAIVSLNSVVRLEQGAVDPRASTIDAVERALRSSGIEFLSAVSEEREGVQIRRRLPRTAKRR